MRAHDVPPPVPAIEVADEAHTLRIRRPDRKVRSTHPIMLARVRPQFLIDMVVIALAEQMQVEVGDV
jgi:hypothetical protein